MEKASANILFMALDDDPDELEIIEEVCKDYRVSKYLLHRDVDEFFKHMNSEINLCLIDHILGTTNGVAVTHRIKAMNKDNYVIISSLIQDFNVAVSYIDAGADKWLKKYELNYLDQLVSALREGFTIARDRIHKAANLKLLEIEALENMKQISKLVARLNPSHAESND